MLYLIKSQQYVKIGFTTDLEKRMSIYTTHNPDFELLDTCIGTLKDEKSLHKQIKDFQFKNEWYYDNPKIYEIWNIFKRTASLKNNLRLLDFVDKNILFFILKLVNPNNINDKIEIDSQWLKIISYELNISEDSILNSLEKLKKLGIIYNIKKSIYVHSYVIHKTKNLLDNRETFCQKIL